MQRVQHFANKTQEGCVSTRIKITFTTIFIKMTQHTIISADDATTTDNAVTIDDDGIIDENDDAFDDGAEQ